MARFIIDDRTLQFETADEVVRYMHANARTQAADDKAYMMDVSDRTITQSGEKIRFATAAEFVNDLVEHGFIKVVGMEQHELFE